MARARRAHPITLLQAGEPPYRGSVEAALQARLERDEELAAAIVALGGAAVGLTATAPVDVTGAAAAVGTGTTAARHDHRHDINVTATLDTIDATRGTLLIRGAAAWQGVDPGTSTHVLTSNGAGADPTYQAASSGLTQEQVEDIVDALVIDSASVVWTYVDATPSLSAAVAPAYLDGTLRWVEVRAIDFASWAATDFAAAGDGTTSLNGGDGALTWTQASTANANSGSSTNGGIFRRNAGDAGSDGASGLRIFHDPSVSTTLSSSTQTGPRMSIALSALVPSLDETSEYRFEVEITRFADSSAGTVPTGITATLALYQAAGTPTGSTARYGGVGMQRNGANEGAPTVLATNDTRVPITAAAYAYSGGHNVLSLMIGSHDITHAYSGDYGADWMADTALRGLGTSTGNVTNNALGGPCLHRDSLLEIGVASRSSATGSVDVMFRRLRVLRRVR